MFTPEKLDKLQHILIEQFKAVYSEQADANEHAYLFVPNPLLTPYAQTMYGYLKDLSDQNNPNFTHFFNDFRKYIENDQVPGVMLSFAIARFQVIRDEQKTRDPMCIAEEKSFVEHLPNPSEAIYSVLTRPSLKDDGTFYTLNESITELQELLEKPANPYKGAFGTYSFNTTEQVTNDICKKLEKALFTEIPNQIAMPMIGKGYLPMSLIVKSLINDRFLAAFPLSKPEDDLKAHGLHFSDTTFGVHDLLHMLADPRNEILYHYAESLLKEKLEQNILVDDAIPTVVARVAAEYSGYKDLLTRFVDSPAAKRNPWPFGDYFGFCMKSHQL